MCPERSRESQGGEAVSPESRTAQALANQALTLERQGEFARAEDCYRESLQANPSLAQSWVNFGAFLFRRKRFREAENAYRRAIAWAPAQASAWSNLGVLLACLKREGEAETCYRHALTCQPDYKKARFNLSYLLLRQGRFEEGWHCFESRDWPVAWPMESPVPRWQGEPLAGKAIQVVAEAGYGDVIQFCRYVPLLKSAGASRVILAVYPALKTLLQSLGGVDEVVSTEDPAREMKPDFRVPLMSLPFLFRTRSDSIPDPLPYLHAPESRKQFWGQQLPQGLLKVGLVWRGNPAHENDADRSLPGLSAFAPLALVPEVRFISLQKDVCDRDAAFAAGSRNRFDTGCRPSDFPDTAALLMNLDLVISVDTAVAHLAGALGRRTWVLLPDYMTDWRWMSAGHHSPWYPGIMRLFRQPAPGDWASVMSEVAGALRGLAPGPITCS
ncbi:MAG: tetratricopeptide repeat protein [Betaproteobacteria bacterium]|nr:tetratricopeptide repeat protein [Betaproteobacteria bacterium]